MSKPKKSREEIIEQVTTVFIENATVTQPTEEAKPQSLRGNLVEIRKIQGVTGFILKDASTAFFDLQDTAKLVEYAIMSSETFNSYISLASLFNMGNMENTLVECTNMQMLCATIGENTVSIFMDRNMDAAGILQKLQA
jgi:hypothetical protein